MFMIERLIDLAARRHGFDRRNCEAEPHPAGAAYRTQPAWSTTAATIPACRRVLELADWRGFDQRKKASRARGRCRGIGLGHYIELNTGAPRERAEIRVLPERRVEVVLARSRQARATRPASRSSSPNGSRSSCRRSS